MSRKTERALLGVAGFVVALVVLVVGVRFLTGTDSVDVTAASLESVEAAASDAEASGSASADGGVGAVPEGPALSIRDSTSSPSSTVSSGSNSDAGSDTSASTVAGADGSGSSSSSTPSSVTASETTTVSPTTIPSTTERSATTPTSGQSTSETHISVPTTTVDPEISEIEREIIRLTNELRTNPSGPQRRIGPMPECVNDDDDIELDPATGHPRPVRQLTPSQPVSIRMSRDWSQQMADADTMSHRSAESQDAVYSELGIDWATRGENVAWAVGYELSGVAQLFFQGWRESDGHYCNMMSGAYTEIGVGHVRTDEGKDFATQNFYRPR